MPLPDLIEIVPLTAPVRAEITVPGSKSITNRALILAALAEGETTLRGALWSEDTQVMVECLQELGFMVNVAPDPDEACNRTITVYGFAGKVPRGGTEAQPLELFVGNAGTAARFLAAMVCLGEGVYRLHGVPRMHERPQAALFAALRELGYRVDSANDRLPALIHGGGPRPGAKCRVSIEESSQFASALLLGAKAGGWKVEIVGENADESPYVAMTVAMQNSFRKFGSVFPVDADASSGSYFWAAGWLWPDELNFPIQVNHWPVNDWQVDSQFPIVLNQIKAGRRRVSRQHDLGDSIMTMAVIAPFAGHSIELTDLGRLRLQECERVQALEAELRKCGANAKDHGELVVTEDGELVVTAAGEQIETAGLETLEVFPAILGDLRGPSEGIETYNDHRMAMCFAVLGLKVPGIKLRNPACVKKTFPNFFQKLAAPPPHGLGVEIRDGRTGRKLGMDELFAD